MDGEVVASIRAKANCSHEDKQKGLLTILPKDQSKWGLCFINHDCPRTMGVRGEKIRWNCIYSR